MAAHDNALHPPAGVAQPAHDLCRGFGAKTAEHDQSRWQVRMETEVRPRQAVIPVATALAGLVEMRLEDHAGRPENPFGTIAGRLGLTDSHFAAADNELVLFLLPEVWWVVG